MSDKEITSKPPRKLRVFLCHSTGDKPLVRALYTRLRADAIDAWLDEEDLVPGQDWELEILRAVRAADIVVACLSKGAVTKSGFIQKEIKLALDVAEMQPEGTIFLIPVRLEKCEVPERLRRWQWVNLFEQEGYARLVRALSVRFEQIIESSLVISRVEPSHNRVTQEITDNSHSRTPADISGLTEISLKTETDIHNALLKRWSSGDKEARDELFKREYSQLKLIAMMMIQSEWEIDGLQPEELLSELSIKLITGEPVKWQNREHFLALSSRLMRRILVDWARRKYSMKRGPTTWVEEKEAKKIISFNKPALTNLEEALRLLEKVAPRAAQIVDLRFYGGLTINEIADSLEISQATAERDWWFARSWLASQLK
ncbi:MAG TPA: ECF-type sigma factor [Pyrinomonadaceae bacterium]|jgi:RNA polymerase sigma factor (TIGR02999 family)|nr:ECF-type sigma factor [Pyrinomonadaceae bacterium]